MSYIYGFPVSGGACAIGAYQIRAWTYTISSSTGAFTLGPELTTYNTTGSLPCNYLEASGFSYAFNSSDLTVLFQGAPTGNYYWQNGIYAWDPFTGVIDTVVASSTSGNCPWNEHANLVQNYIEWSMTQQFVEPLLNLAL
jgi:hypothetical protein